MEDTADRLVGGLLTADDALDREFEARIAENATLAFRVAYSVVRERQDAEDVSQEAFVRAHREFGRLRDRSRFRAWLVRTTWRLSLDFQRAKRRRAAREQAVALPTARDDSGEDAIIARERAQRLWQAIDALPEKLRIVTVLAAMEGHDIQEVAELLNLPTGTVKFRLFSARRQLRERLG